LNQNLNDDGWYDRHSGQQDRLLLATDEETFTWGCGAHLRGALPNGSSLVE